MLEPMAARVEVWPVAADDLGIWLISGDDAWRTSPVPADSEPHAELESLLHAKGVLDDTAVLHSTSWRVDGPHVFLTYMAVIRTDDLARSRWPASLPVLASLPEAVGKPPTHAPTEAPIPRYIDVLMHGLRHLRFLLDNDATNAAALPPEWSGHLAPLQPALATMYDEHHKTFN